MRAEKTGTLIRQEQIVEAALNVINRQGMKELSVGGVARSVGLVPSAIYRHFKSKDDVLEAIIDLIRDKLQTNIKAVCKETPDPFERLRRLLMRHVRTIRENQAIPRIIFSEDLYSGHPERKAKVYGIIRDYLREVGEIIRQGQRIGQMRSDLDLETMTLLFLGMIQPAGFLWFLSDAKFDITKHVGKAWDIFSEVVRAK